MKVALLQVEDPENPVVYGDFAGGFGAGFSPGKSVFNRLVRRMKFWGVDLPLMSIGYLAAIFKQKGHDVQIAYNPATLDADLVIIHTSLRSWNHQCHAATRFKSEGKHVGFIGPFSSVKPELFLPHAHFVVCGEAEGIFLHCDNVMELKGEVKSEPVMHLDELPFPDWSEYRHVKFRYFPSLIKSPVFPVLASRGCPDKCVYCPYKVLYNKFRARSIPNIIEELRYRRDRQGAKGFLYRDPYFSFLKKRTLELCDELRKNELTLPWVCETKIDTLDEETLTAMAKAGLSSINLGIESVNPVILEKAGRKALDYSETKQIFALCEKLGVKVTAFFILGWPDDTTQSIKATIDLAIDLNPHIATFTLFTPFPGTETFNELENQLTSRDWTKFDVMNVVYKHPQFSESDLIEFKEQAYRRFYYRPQYLFSFLKRMGRSEWGLRSNE